MTFSEFDGRLAERTVEVNALSKNFKSLLFELATNFTPDEIPDHSLAKFVEIVRAFNEFELGWAIYVASTHGDHYEQPQ